MNNNMKNQNYKKMTQCTNVNGAEVPQDQQGQSGQGDRSSLFSTRYIQGILKEAEGYFVIIEFLIGTQLLVEKQGYITDVGVNFVTLYNPESDMFITCDMYSIKFVNFTEFRNPEYIDEFQKKLEDYRTK